MRNLPAGKLQVPLRKALLALAGAVLFGVALGAAGVGMFYAGRLFMGNLEAWPLVVGGIGTVLLGLATVGLRGGSGHDWMGEVSNGHVEDVEDVRGWKTADLDLTGTFHGVSHGTYQSDDVAVCETWGGHEAPQPNCRCGFYALTTRRAAEAMQRLTGAGVLLEVDLYGTIVEHEKGVRAGEQVVLAVHLHTRCRICLRAADGVAEDRGGTRVVAACERCRKTRSGTSKEELEELLGTEVHHDVRRTLNLRRKGTK